LDDELLSYFELMGLPDSCDEYVRLEGSMKCTIVHFHGHRRQVKVPMEIKFVELCEFVRDHAFCDYEDDGSDSRLFGFANWSMSCLSGRSLSEGLKRSLVIGEELSQLWLEVYPRLTAERIESSIGIMFYLSFDGIQIKGGCRSVLGSEEMTARDQKVHCAELFCIGKLSETRVVQTRNGNVTGILKDATWLSECTNPFRVERIPKDQVDAEHASLIQVRLKLDPPRRPLHFFLRMIDGEMVKDTRVRLGGIVGRELTDQWCFVLHCRYAVSDTVLSGDSVLSDYIRPAFTPGLIVSVDSPRAKKSQGGSRSSSIRIVN